MRLDEISEPGRLAEPGEGISTHELALAARNHGMPLEALRYDVTPPGLHYLLIHYDIPFVDRRVVAAAGRRRRGPAPHPRPRHIARPAGTHRPGDHGVRR